MVEVGPHSYNLKQGGEGGWDYVNSSMSLSKRKESGKLGGNKCRDLRLGFLKEDKETRVNRILKYGNPGCWYSAEQQRRATEAAQSDNAVKKRKETFKIIKHAQGSKNSQYGTMWITDGSTNRKIKKEEVIPEGWRKGRQKF